MQKGYVFLLMFFVSGSIWAQVSVTNGSPSFLIDFSNTTPTSVGSNPSTAYAGAGFEPNTITGGRLNSNAWATTGFSDGSLPFGGTNTAGDHARGSTGVAETTGGIYAFTGLPGSPDNPALMIQPSTLDFTPGNLILRIQNNGIDNISQLAVTYNLFVRNDEDYSNSFNFSYSTDDVIYTPVGALDYSSPQALDGLGWVLVGTAPSRSTTITGLNVLPGGFIYIRWSGDDVGGSGSRDEFGLDDISATATFTPASTDHYRSVATGNWNNASTWETSPDNVTWVAAVLPPTYLANTITIESGHTVTVVASTTADQVVVSDFATLQHSSGTFTIEDGIGRDVDINSDGVLLLTTASTSPTFGVGSPTIYNGPGGIIRVSATGLTGAGTGINANNYFYGHQSVLELTLTSAFSTSGVIFFPTVNADTIPIFRTTNTGNILVGSNNYTTINGVFECNGADVSWQNAGAKTFRNGIRGPGNVIALISSGKFIINGTTAELGGTGSLILPTVGLEIGSASNATAVFLISDKIVTGDISLLSANNTFVDPLNADLTVTGNINGGTTNAYVRTSGFGFLKLTGVTTSRTFPIGSFSGYNPLVISNGGGVDYSARLENSINPLIAFPTYGINRTWNIQASAPNSGVIVDFQYATADANAGVLPQPQAMEILQYSGSAWSVIAGNTGINPTGADPAWIVTTATGLAIPNASPSPYALGKNGGWILPIDCIISCRSRKINNTGFISWDINSCAEVNSFEVQRSVNGSAYQTIGTVIPSTPLEYNYSDASLAGGTNLYRIKVNRSSGAVKYSNTVAIINDTQGILITALSPNPVKDNAALIINGAKAGSINFSIYDIMGRPLRQWQSIITEGSNTINVNAIGLVGGIYQLAATNGDSKTVIRFVKE